MPPHPSAAEGTAETGQRRADLQGLGYRGPEADSSTEVASVKVRGEKRMIKINA